MGNIELYTNHGGDWLFGGKFNSVNQAVKHARATLDKGVKCQVVDSEKFVNSVVKQWTINGRSKV